MKNLRASCLAAVSGLVFLSLAAAPLAGQAAAGKAQTIPRQPDGHPDFTGVYAGPGFSHRVGPDDTDTPRVSTFDKNLFPPFKPGGREKFYQKATGDVRHDDPTAVCLPDAHPREALAPYAQQWVQGPGHIVILYEYMHFFRYIPTDGRPHPKDVELTYMGDPVGHWEGDTLVIDTIGLKSYPLDAASFEEVRYHSDSLHTIERLKHIDATTIDYQITLDDPEIFEKPFTQTFQMKLHPTWKIFEQICEDNNRCEAGHCSSADNQKSAK
jgi:hypothetical protein